MSFLSREDKPEHPLEGCLFQYGNMLWNEDISIVSNFFFSPSDDFLIIMFLFAGKTAERLGCNSPNLSWTFTSNLQDF